jgi:hypothetical protein
MPTRRVTIPPMRRVTTMAQPLAFMRMLRIGDIGDGTTVDGSERSDSLVIFRARLIT